MLVGCVSTPTSTQQPNSGTKPAAAPEPSAEAKSRQALTAGVSGFGNGDYAGATRNLQAALDLGLEPRDQVKAHKYLAFTNCVTGKARACRDEFVKALQIDPAMELEPAEAGHPIWGPVFKNAKAGMKSGAKTGSKTKPKKPTAATQK